MLQTMQTLPIFTMIYKLKKAGVPVEAPTAPMSTAGIVIITQPAAPANDKN